MPPVCSNSVRRRSASAQPKRRATPGRYQTGSIAAFTTTTSPAALSTAPSACSRPARTASASSGKRMWALVTAMVGWMS